MTSARRTLILASMALPCLTAYSQINDPIISIAAGVAQPLRIAPSVVSIITAEDIQALGADDLDQVLETVPGLHVSRSPVGYAPIYVIRGIRGALLNPEVLMLMNGVPMTAAYAGDRGPNWGGWPVANIARIEIIRGPASALYGADAFSGVINIITKTSPDITGTQVGAQIGSYKTHEAWLLHGSRIGPFDISIFLNGSRTSGSRPTITADAQTGLDHLFAPSGVAPVSLAPGPANNWHNAFDASLDVSTGPWRLRTGYDTRALGSGAGVAQALDPTGRNTGQRITSDLTYDDPALTQDWALKVQASGMRYIEHSNLVLFPPGTNLGHGVFTDGAIGNPSKYERHGRFSVSGLYTGFNTHHIRLGTGYEVSSLYEATETKNFNPDFSPIGTGSTSDVVDVTNTVPFIRPQTRRVHYAYAQDEWRFLYDWTLTAGIRQDRYSDFGKTTNPRVALVWSAPHNITAKLLYGSAFRAPSFLESNLINNPAAIGNPGLKAETIKTLEGAVSWRDNMSLQWDINVFRYEISNLIHIDSGGRYQNGGRQIGQGVGMEAAWQASHNLRLTSQVSLQHSTDESTHHDAGMSPHVLARLHTDWRITPDWQSGWQINMVGPRQRANGDPRPTLPGYTTMDLSLSHHDVMGNWAVTATVHNIFSANQREPSAFGLPVTQIPNDIPLGRRSFLIEVRHPF